MAITLLTVVQRVCRNVGLDPTITTFSNDDETNDVVQDVAESYEELITQLPTETVYLHAASAITTVASTRSYALASDAASFDLYRWSFNNSTDNYHALTPATTEFILDLDAQYQTRTGKPQYVYSEGSDAVCFYPVPDGVYTIAYQYGKSVITRLSATTDTFIIPDRWVLYITKRAQAKYERRKGFADPDATDTQALFIWYEIMEEALSELQLKIIEEGF